MFLERGVFFHQRGVFFGTGICARLSQGHARVQVRVLKRTARHFLSQQNDFLLHDLTRCHGNPARVASLGHACPGLARV